jgi:glycosyltransferase involved in cell wall biosynthesis
MRRGYGTDWSRKVHRGRKIKRVAFSQSSFCIGNAGTINRYCASGNPMRILQIHPFLRSEKVVPTVGGMSRTALGLTCHLQNNGHDVAVYPWPEWLWGEPVRFGVASGVSVLIYAPLAIPERKRLFHNWKAVRGSKRPAGLNTSAWIDLCFLTGLQNAFREFRPQIIHCHYATSGLPGLFRLLNPKTPIVLTHHTSTPDAGVEVYDRIILLREAETKAGRVLPGYPEAKIRIIEKPVMKDSPRDAEKAQTRSDSAFDRYVLENLRLYNELIPMGQPISS